MGGRGEAKTRGVWEIVGGGGVCMSIWFPLCVCMFVFVGEERESWERGGWGEAEGISWSVNLEEMG